MRAGDVPLHLPLSLLLLIRVTFLSGDIDTLKGYGIQYRPYLIRTSISTILDSSEQTRQCFFLSGNNNRARLNPERTRITPNAKNRVRATGANEHVVHLERNMLIYHIVPADTIIFDRNASTGVRGSGSEPDIVPP